MKRENWQKVKQIFSDALEVEYSERESFLNDACAGDGDLRREVDVLLHSFEEGFLEKPAVGHVAEAFLEREDPVEAGEQIDHYKILERLGVGGQGSVYLALDKKLNRRVALKFLPPATVLDRHAIRRFRREAESAAALSHPNICAIHEIVETDGRAFLVMPFVEGETLSDRLKKEKPSVQTVLVFAIQIADALAEAHLRGVIHRDIKPSNIIVSANEQVKILDFGLAKRIVSNIEKQSFETQSGMILGTGAYMSPEQARGLGVDERTDIWSFGAVLYEMLAGKQLFARETLADTLAAIVSVEPSLAEIPPRFREIISKALQKERDKRYARAADLLADLRGLQQELSFEEQLRSHEMSFEAAKPALPVGWLKIIAVGALLAILTFGGWFYLGIRNQNWLRESVQKAEELAAADKTFEAYDLVSEIQKYQPDEPTALKLMPTISDGLTVKSEPPGASVFLKRFQPDGSGKFPEREFIGTTPIENHKIARGQYLLYLEKEGFAPFTRSISGRLPEYTTDLIWMPPVELSVELFASEKTPEKMIYIPGGEYKLVAFARATDEPVKLAPFFIDRAEVSNREFKEFVTAGGYLKKEFWKHPFVKNGREISFEDALREFKDKTGLAAPRSWTNQNFPEGKADFPVTDVTWYEAAAYAEFRGKSLPTVFQWEKAARDGKYDEGWNTMPWGLSRNADSPAFLANFSSGATMQVESFEFGASPYGCLNMAGNVGEWIFNHRGENVGTVGGAWSDLPYAFGDYGEYPPAHNSDRIGFRLVKNLSESERGAGDLPQPEIPVFQKTSVQDLKKWATHYEYDKAPIEARAIETVETDAWTREKISFVSAGGETAFAYLYLPRNAPRPLQVVHWIPAADVPLGFSSLPHSVEGFLAPIIKSGRAVFAVVVQGYNERPRAPNYKFPAETSIEYRKILVNRVTDWRRGLDYLETRADVDLKKLAFIGLSNGANQGLLLTAIDRRYVSAIFVGGGIVRAWQERQPEANFINFAPHVAQPKLFLKGLYDEAHPMKTESEPLYKILSEPKRLTVVESGHVPPPEIFAPAVNNWLDETLGKVGS